MKTIDLFCASPASTAVCSSMDHRAVIRHGMRSIDRQVHRLGGTPKSRTNAPPCSSHLPFDPASYDHKPRKSASEALRRKSCADAEDLATSSRYLLSDKPYDAAQLASSKPLLIGDNYEYKRFNSGGFPAFRSMSTRSAYESPVYDPSSTRLNNQVEKISSGKLGDHLTAQKSASNHQVVELRVSIHCKGCEGKLRKYISRMEGVRSFSIDLGTKKVTVIGNVTAVGVLTSISKVKKAEFWGSTLEEVPLKPV